jgi:CheY-like chemotaxis protein
MYVDEEANSEAMASKFDVMKSYDIEVRIVVEVANALPTLREQRDIALVILDIIMPPKLVYSLEETQGGSLTGLRLLRDIRKEFPLLPVMLVSVMPREAAEEAVRLYNVVDYYTKPVTGSQLAEAVSRILETAR